VLRRCARGMKPSRRAEFPRPTLVGERKREAEGGVGRLIYMPSGKPAGLRVEYRLHLDDDGGMASGSASIWLHFE
jgi:hypothetical protein